MLACAVFLQCTVLALYNDVPVSGREDIRSLCTRGAHGCSVKNRVILLDDCHSSSKEICGEKRGANDER